MDETGIAIFVKTPGLSPVKTRLSATMGEEFSKEFYLRTVEITKEIVENVKEFDPTLIPYWAVAEEKGGSSSLWANFETLWQGRGGLGDRLFKVYDQLIERHGSALIIGSDAPLLSSEHILEALAVVQKKEKFVMGPAGDGGFYLFGGSRKVPHRLWTKVQYSQSDTGEQLRVLLSKIGNIHELNVVSDVDVKGDILTILSFVQNQDHLLQGQKELIRWMSKCVSSSPKE